MTKIPQKPHQTDFSQIYQMIEEASCLVPDYAGMDQ